MKITDTLKNPAAAPPAGQGPVAQGGQTSNARAAEKASVPTPASDSVRLSAQAQEIAPRMNASAVFDVKKVEKIRLAIADGHFQVNAEKVADGLLETVRDLLHSRKRGA